MNSHRDDLSDAPPDRRAAVAAAATAPPPHFHPEALLQALGRLPGWSGQSLLAAEYRSAVGLWEGYTLARHTTMVLGQYRRYFEARGVSAEMPLPFLRLLLALHDCGKPAAIRAGDRGSHGRLTVQLAWKVWPHLPLGRAQFLVFGALVGGDPLGRLLRAEDESRELDRVVAEVSASARTARMAPLPFLDLLLLYFQCDTASYTADAGGLPSLDGLFATAGDGSGLLFDLDARRLRFNERNERRLGALRRALGG